MKVLSSLLTIGSLGVIAPATFAADLDTGTSDSKAAAAVTMPGQSSPWRFGADYAPFLGLKTNFNGLGRFRSPFAPQPLGGGRNYDYDNGFVYVDSSGNLGGQTWNWGYANNSQYNPAGTGSINYTLTNSLANGHAEEDGGGKAGFELTGYRDMGPVNWAAVGGRQATWGLRGGLQYAHVGVSNHDLLASGITTTTDSFDLGGTLPPGAPYTGSFGGPGPLLGDSPTRTVTTGPGALISGSRDMDTDLFIANFGPYLEIPVTDHFDLMLEGGVSFAVASGKYDFFSSTTIAGAGTQQSTGSASDTKVLPGLYLGLSGVYKINDQWSLQASGRYQYMKQFDLGANGSQASLSFDSAFVVSVGVLYSF